MTQHSVWWIFHVTNIIGAVVHARRMTDNASYIHDARQEVSEVACEIL